MKQAGFKPEAGLFHDTGQMLRYGDINSLTDCNYCSAPLPGLYALLSREIFSLRFQRTDSSCQHVYETAITNPSERRQNISLYTSRMKE